MISPLLANSYMHRFTKVFRKHGLGRRYWAVLVTYADDFVILCHRGADEILKITRRWMKSIGFDLNEDKTRVRNTRDEHSDFLGYTFGPCYWSATGKCCLGATPLKKATKRLKRYVRGLLRPGNMEPWEVAVAWLNRILRGWGNYYRYGTLA